jgi:RNA polymerase sigma factor (sigma-70 family)
MNGARSDDAEDARRADDSRGWVLAALERHEAGLTRYAERLTGDVNTARDVVQHVFLQLCDHPPAQRNGHLASWLFTVCHNRAMDHRRRSTRTTSLEAVAAETLGCGGDDPAKRAEAEDAAAVVREVIETLPDSHRLVVQFWSAGFGYREIAELLDKTEGYVRVASHRAWQTIRNHPRVRKLLSDG